MSCPNEDLRAAEIQRLIEYVNANSTTYQESANYYLTATSSTSAQIINSALGNTTNTAQISGDTLLIDGTIVTKNITYNTANQNKPYLVAGTTDYNGATTNWGTYGLQHRIKTNASSTPRITIDSRLGELVNVDGETGEVGIGILNPQAKLHVNGTLQTNGAITVASGGSSYLTLTTSATGSTASEGGAVNNLPSKPEGYVQIIINGTVYKMPFYPN